MASKKILIQVDVTTKAAEVQIKNVAKSMNDLEGATAKFTETTKKSRAQSGLNNAILIESGRFASDLRFGFTAVANNLGRIIELGQEFSRTEGGGLIPALRRIFTVQGLLLIGFQLVVAYGDKIFNFFRGVTEEAQKAAKAQEELNKQLDELGARVFLMQDYVDVIENANTTEETRKNLTQELINLVPQLEEEDFKYGQNLDNVRKKIEDYALSQATRIEIDRLVQENSEVLANAAAVRRISEIDDEQERANEMRKFLEREGMDVDARIRERRYGTQSIIESEIEAIYSLFSLQTTASVLAAQDVEKKLDVLYSNIRSRNLKQTETEKKNTEDNFKIREVDFTKGNIRMQNLANRFGAKAIENQFDRNQAELEAQRDFYFNQIDQTLALETEKERARYEVNKYFSEQIIKNQEAEAEARKQITLGIVSTYAKALGSLSQLLGKNTAAGKVAALGEIAAGTAVGFIQALDIAQKAAKGTGPLASLAFPVFYASQVAAVLGAAAQAKQVLESGRPTSSRPSGVSSGPASSITTEAPDFNVVGIGGVSQLGQAIGAQFGQPLRAYVVSSDVSTGQALERNITGNAKLG
jgi:hypothetical protein